LIGAGICASIRTYSTTGKPSIDKCKNVVFLRNTVISHNKGVVGCELYFHFKLESNHGNCPLGVLNATNCTFESNALQVLHQGKYNGVAVHTIFIHHEHDPSKHLRGHFKAYFESSTFSNSVTLCKESKDNTSPYYGATLVALYVAGCPLM
jgi:hypothetical protein